MSIKQSRFAASFLIQDLITGNNDIQYNSYLPDLMNIPEFEAELRLLASLNLSVLSGSEYRLCSYELVPWGDENGREDDESYVIVIKAERDIRINYHQPLLGTDIFRNVSGGAGYKVLSLNGSSDGFLDDGSNLWIPVDNDGSLAGNISNNSIGMNFLSGAMVYIYETTGSVPTDLSVEEISSSINLKAFGTVVNVDVKTDTGTLNTQTVVQVANPSTHNVLPSLSLDAGYTRWVAGIYQTSVFEGSLAVLQGTNTGAIQLFNPNSSATAVQVGIYKIINE